MTRPERLGDIGRTSAPEFEAEIREFVRRDLAPKRRADAPTAVNSVDTLIERVAGASLMEIDRVITELQTMRDMLHAEGERVRRELTNYAGLSQTAMLSMKIISDGLMKRDSRTPALPDAS